MTAIEDARAALENYGSLAEPAQRPRKRLADALRALIAEHERLTAEMHQRELHHFETEQILVQAGIDPDATPPTDDEREALAQAALDSERLRQIAEWLSMEHGHEETARRVNLIADHHDRLAAGFRRQGPITEAAVNAAWRVIEDRDQRYITHDDMRDALEAARDAS